MEICGRGLHSFHGQGFGRKEFLMRFKNFMYEMEIYRRGKQEKKR